MLTYVVRSRADETADWNYVYAENVYRTMDSVVAIATQHITGSGNRFEVQREYYIYDLSLEAMLPAELLDEDVWVRLSSAELCVMSVASNFGSDTATKSNLLITAQGLAAARKEWTEIAANLNAGWDVDYDQLVKGFFALSAAGIVPKNITLPLSVKITRPLADIPTKETP